MIGLIAALLSVSTPAVRVQPQDRCRVKSYVDKTGEWIGPCELYSWWHRWPITVQANTYIQTNGVTWDYQHKEIRVDSQGYVICSGTPQATADSLLRVQEDARRRYKELADYMDELAP